MTLTLVKVVEEEGYVTRDGNVQTKKTRRGCPGRGEGNRRRGWESRERLPLSSRQLAHLLSSQQAADVSLHGFWQRHLGVGVLYVCFYSQETRKTLTSTQATSPGFPPVSRFKSRAVL